MNQTNQKLIFLVVGSAAFMALLFVLTLEIHFLFFPDHLVNDKVFQAMGTAGSSVLSFLFGVLVNTRTAPPSTQTEATITTTTAPEPPTEPAPVIVTNSPTDPVPVSTEAADKPKEQTP